MNRRLFLAQDAILFKATLLTRVDLFVLVLVVFFVTLSDGEESQMGSRKHHLGRRVEDHFVRASYTLGPLGEGAQSDSRCKSQRLCPSRHRDQCRRSPPELQAAVHAKIERLQAAISALGDADKAEKESLVKFPHRAQAQAVLPPVSEQIASTQGFIERERKRFAAAEEAVLFAVKNRDESLEALAQGEKRLEELQSQQRSPFTGLVDDTETELVRLRAQVANLQGSVRGIERRRTRAAEMPSLVPAELSEWMEDRQKDLEEAVSTGDHSRVVVLSSTMTQGAERMLEMTRQELSDDEYRSRTAPGEAVRTLLRVAHTSRCLARYGHRGTSVGEAAHPGPSRRLTRVRHDRNVAPRLPTLATLVDSSVSDDEMPLLSGFTGPQDRDDVHDDGTIDPFLLNSLAEDLGVTQWDTIPASRRLGG